MKYYCLDFTLDKKIRGRYERPHTIIIESQDFLKYHVDNFRNIRMYFENRNTLYDEMPDNLQGKLLKRKNVVDFMDSLPFCLSLIAVVSEKMKQILERLNVSKDEYVLKRISINGFSDDFYLLFVPIIENTEVVYPKSVFIDDDNNSLKIYNNREECLRDLNLLKCRPFKVTLKDKYQDYDLLFPQIGGSTKLPWINHRHE